MTFKDNNLAEQSESVQLDEQQLAALFRAYACLIELAEEEDEVVEEEAIEGEGE